MFTPSKEMKEALAGATFEVDGVVEEGIKYGSIQSYRKVKGLDTGGGEEGGGSTGDGGDGEL